MLKCGVAQKCLGKKELRNSPAKKIVMLNQLEEVTNYPKDNNLTISEPPLFSLHSDFVGNIKLYIIKMYVILSAIIYNILIIK